MPAAIQSSAVEGGLRSGKDGASSLPAAQPGGSLPGGCGSMNGGAEPAPERLPLREAAQVDCRREAVQGMRGSAVRLLVRTKARRAGRQN